MQVCTTITTAFLCDVFLKRLDLRSVLVAFQSPQMGLFRMSLWVRPIRQAYTHLAFDFRHISQYSEAFITQKPCVANLRKPIFYDMKTLWVVSDLSNAVTAQFFPWPSQLSVIMYKLSAFGSSSSKYFSRQLPISTEHQLSLSSFQTRSLYHCHSYGLPNYRSTIFVYEVLILQ